MFLLLLTNYMKRPKPILPNWAFRPENSPALKQRKGPSWWGHMVSGTTTIKYDLQKQV